MQLFLINTLHFSSFEIFMILRNIQTFLIKMIREQCVIAIVHGFYDVFKVKKYNRHYN